MDKRTFIKLALSAPICGFLLATEGEVGTKLETWRPGCLDIHHLAYGRGNATFILCPDGTSMLVDAGTNRDAADVSCPQKPNDRMRPGEWIAAYLLRHMAATGGRRLDYALITHIHPDHLGDVGPENPLANDGRFRLTGISDVTAKVPVSKLIDRGYPNYAYPTSYTAPYALNYLNFVRARREAGGQTERFQAGSETQLRLLRDAGHYPSFAIRNLAANGEVWTGGGEQTSTRFPDLKTLERADYPTENMCSLAIRLSYGKFSYFTGGDLTADAEEPGEAWRDIETPVAQVAGQVEVAVANHHGYFDAVGPNFVRALRPQVFVVPAWYVAHPATLPLRRMLSRRLTGQDSDVYATCTMAANRVVNNQFTGKLRSLEGHVIVRVTAGGESYRVFVTDNSEDEDRITVASAVYRCR